MLRILLKVGCRKECFAGDMINEEVLVEAVLVEEMVVEKMAIRYMVTGEVIFEGCSLQDGLL